VSSIKWLAHSGVDKLGFEYDSISFVSEWIGGHAVCFARNREGIFVVAASGAEAIERTIGHRGPFPTEEAALTYLQLVKD
jgi:hypothetical protein